MSIALLSSFQIYNINIDTIYSRHSMLCIYYTEFELIANHSQLTASSRYLGLGTKVVFLLLIKGTGFSEFIYR